MYGTTVELNRLLLTKQESMIKNKTKGYKNE